MKTIGLIGGMSWESTAVYYRLVNEMVRDRLGGLHSARVLMASVDFDDVVRLQRAGDWDAARRGGARPGGGGRRLILICTNTMHLVADRVAAAVDVPLIHIVDETAAALKARGMRRPLLLATRYTMEHGFYADRMAGHGIEVVVPEAPDRAEVHRVIFDELCQGIVSDGSRQALDAIVGRGMAAGVDSVILGCTEICLSLTPDHLPLPTFDSTAIHARAAVDHALSEVAALRVAV